MYRDTYKVTKILRYYVQGLRIKTTCNILHITKLRRALIRIHKNIFKFFLQGKIDICTTIFIVQVLTVFLVENKIVPVKRVLCMFPPPNVDGL